MQQLLRVKATRAFSTNRRALLVKVTSQLYCIDTPRDGEEVLQIPAHCRSAETTEVKRSRLLYQSRKRGMLENGLLLGTFASRYLRSLSVEQLDEYDMLINKPSNDWDIYHWITGKKEVPSEYNNSVMKIMQEHVKNKNKEFRVLQPSLQKD